LKNGKRKEGWTKTKYKLLLNPKKIIFTVTNDLTYDQRMLRICSTLATEGYQVQLVGRQLQSSKPFDNQYFTTHRFRLLFNKGKLFYIEYNARLFFWLLTQRFDIVCGIDLDSILPCYSVAILRGKQCVYDAHELYSETPEVTRRPMIRKVWLAVEKFIVPRVKYRYTVSQSVADEFEKRYGTKFELIRNLPFLSEKLIVNSEKFTQSLSTINYPLSTIHYPLSIIHYKLSTKIILYQGNLNEGRGLEASVEAMQYLENAELWIVGDGDLMPILRGMVMDLKLENKVKFWGYVAPKDLPAITEQATVGLNILENKSLSYQCSLSNKTTDYIQAGLPQIFINFIEHQKINAAFNVGVLIEDLKTETLVTALKSLFENPELYNTLKINCFEAAKILNWENEKVKLIEFYKKIN
jgi:glycosyltransferase involved in cell wall biosynthesis